MTATSSTPLGHLLLCLADDELVLGHRDSEWTAFAPFIEEDIALASIAQDEISHASVFLGLLSDSPDRVAFLRGPEEFRNTRLLERPNGDWAFTCVRHLLYDIFDDLRLEALGGSNHRPLAEAVDRLRREERYHLLHGRAWIARLGAAEGEGRDRLQQAVDAVLADAGGLFESGPLQAAARDSGLFPGGVESLVVPWLEIVGKELAAIGLAGHLPTPATLGAGGIGGRSGNHGEDLASLLNALGEVYRSDPEAVW